MNPDKKIRRLQSLLYTSGTGTILFSLWSGIRQVGNVQYVMKKLVKMDQEIVSVRVLRIVWVLILLLIFVQVFLYVYVGVKARLVSLGKNKSKAYIVWAFILIVITLTSYLHDFSFHTVLERLQNDNLLLFVIDFTSTIILGEVIIFSILLKKMRD